MGASTLASLDARRAVLTEGVTDVILLPRLLREAMGLEKLGFQVAPGLASVSPNDIQKLELEAPKVAYFVDGDNGGKKIANKLLSEGVSEDLIIMLEEGYVIEDFLDANVYVNAVNEELRRSHGEGYELKATELPSVNRPEYVKQWCKKSKVKVPNKQKIAARLVEKTSINQIFDLHQKEALEEIFKNISATLSPEKKEKVTKM